MIKNCFDWILKACRKYFPFNQNVSEQGIYLYIIHMCTANTQISCYVIPSVCIGNDANFAFLICVIWKSKAILILIKLIYKHKYLSYLKLFMVVCLCFSFDMRRSFFRYSSSYRYCCYYCVCVWLLLWCSFDIMAKMHFLFFSFLVSFFFFLL